MSPKNRLYIAVIHTRTTSIEFIFHTSIILYYSEKIYLLYNIIQKKTI